MNYTSKTIFQINQGQITHELEGKSDGSLSQYVTIDVKHIPHSKGTTGKNIF